MKKEKELEQIINKVSKMEILKLKQSYKENKMIDNYIYKISKKIYKKLAFSYFRFEILLRSVDDIINNNEFYPNMPKKEIKKQILYIYSFKKFAYI